MGRKQQKEHNKSATKTTVAPLVASTTNLGVTPTVISTTKLVFMRCEVCNCITYNKVCDACARDIDINMMGNPDDYGN
jgi:recombinational DNA repair protein RecR